MRLALALTVVSAHLSLALDAKSARGSSAIGLGELIRARNVGSPALVDGRSLEDYKVGHIPGAAHFESLPDLSGKQAIVYCANSGCGASRRAAERASSAGAASVRIYWEGYLEWKSCGLAIEITQ